jgi:sigma-E factor negative regulatory protein RseA
MKQDISSLMDGELDGPEAARVIRSCCASEDSKDTWNLYHVIGESMRGHAPATLERRAGFCEALAKEPTVLAPRTRVLETTIGRIALAAAASVATIGVVSWIGTQGAASDTQAGTVVKATSPALLIQPVAATSSVPSQAPIAAPQALDVQDYLTAHRQIPSPEAYRPVANRGAAPAR